MWNSVRAFLVHGLPTAFCGTLLLLGALARAQVSASDPRTDSTAQMMEPFRVSSDRLAASEIEGPTTIDTYDAEHINDTGAFSVDEFLETLPPADADGEQLVLIDGRPTYLDPSSLPLSMIEGIDVSRDGAMPNIGAYSSGRIVNIRLKKNYRGLELGGRALDSFADGGDQQTARLSGGATSGKLRTIFSFEFARSGELRASERSFSAEQDHRARGGSDLRLGWGYPAVVRAASGNLAGVTDANGGPVSVALVPEHQSGRKLMPADFLPADPLLGEGAANQRRFNTAAYRTLVTPSKRASANLSFTYSLSDRLELSLSGSHTTTRSERLGAPPVSSASDETLVPAALNPFGQDVEVGLVHWEFGPTRQKSRSERSQAGLQVNGKLAGSWKWEGGIGYRRNDSHQATTDLHPDRFSAALTAADPAQRFNPFGDARVAPVNAHLYPSLLAERVSTSSNRQLELELSASGTLREIWGGPVTLDLDTEYSRDRRHRVSSRSVASAPTESRLSRSSQEYSGSLHLPLFGRANARPGLRRLDAQISGEYSTESDGGRETDQQLGLVWSPTKALLLRATRYWNVETPSRSAVAGTDTLVGESVIDPRRGFVAVNDVDALTRGTVDAVAEESERQSFGVTLEPPFVKALRLSATYSVRREHHILQDDFEPQEIVNNEAAFPGRVIRAAPTPEEAAQGLPGPIVAVDITPGNTGEAERRELDLSLEYRLQAGELGQFRLAASAERAMGSRYEVLPGVPFVSDGPSRYHRADWEFRGRLSWSRGSWNASSRVSYAGPVPATGTANNAVASYTTVDFNAGYSFRQPVWRGLGRGLRLTLGIRNVFDTPPPFADTLNGYRGGSPLGRTWSLAFTLPFSGGSRGEGRDNGGDWSNDRDGRDGRRGQ